MVRGAFDSVWQGRERGDPDGCRGLPGPTPGAGYGVAVLPFAEHVELRPAYRRLDPAGNPTRTGYRARSVRATAISAGRCALRPSGSGEVTRP